MAYKTAVPIGAGGMGEVFKAWDAELERPVALKYLRHDDPELVERLMREARAQARVDHPSVCKVYEVGEEDGRPFIAMEYVEGRLLDEVAGELTVEQKVLLIQQVAEAIQAAHIVGLIHRDLKPGNIIVGETADGRLHPWVLDFGIAREQEAAGLTVTGQVLGTPGYLSPEQALGDPKAVDRRTDVFSLGVVLYELLGGRKPFDGDGGVEVLVNLLEHEPAPLRRHWTEVPADLETVVMRCLEKRPESRYPSARALADDLGRFLAGEPVEARPITGIQRLARKARKHPFTTGVVAMSTVIVLALATALIVGWIRYTADLKRERNAALEALAMAEQKEREASEVTSFLVDVFETSDPSSAKGGDTTAREILDRGLERIGEEFAEQPAVKARLLHTIGTISIRLGLVADAEPLLAEAVGLREGLEPAEPDAVAASLSAYGKVLTELDRFDEAETALARALELLEEHDGPDSLEITGILGNQCSLMLATGRWDQAEPLYRRTIAIKTTALGADHVEVAESLDGLGVALHRMGRLDEAGATFERALAVREASLGPDHLGVANTLNNQGILLTDQGRYEQAVPVLERALAILEVHYDPDHPSIANTLSSLSNALRRQGRFAEAEPPLLRALAIREQALGPEHTRVGASYNSLGNISHSLERLDEAEVRYARAAAIFERALGAEHPWLAIPITNLANIALKRQRWTAAESGYRRSLAIREQAYGPDHPEIAMSLLGLAQACSELGHVDEAETHFARALAIRQAKLPSDHPFLLDTRRMYAEFLRGQGREDEARAVEGSGV
jgi:serine/threonine-protein kinase